MPRLTLSTLSIATLLIGCSTQPMPLTDDHPASPNAPAGARTGEHSSLHVDELTQKSRALLSAAAKEQKEWDEHGPVSGTPADENPSSKPKAMPGMSAEEMKGMKP